MQEAVRGHMGKGRVFVTRLPECKSRPKHLLTSEKVLSFSAVQFPHL